jgi:xylulokinase
LSATPHLLWIKNNEPDIYRRIFKYTEASGYVVQKLTGRFVLDYSMASGLDYGFDTRTLDYNDDLIAAMNLDRGKYPELCKNTEAVGVVSKQAAAETGLLSGTPVFLAGLDIVSAAIAGGAIKPGQGYYSMGSASNMMLVSEAREGTPNLSSLLHILDPDTKCYFGSQGSVGFSLKWFRDQFGGPERYAAASLDGGLNPFEIMTAEAQKTGPGAGGLVYLPFLFGKFHPTFNEHAQGVFFGINATTSKGQLIRSIMEGCTYNMYETIKESRKIGIDVKEILTSGGPSRSDLWCQIIADVTNRRVVTINTPEASPMGNALLVGVAAGVFPSFQDAVDRFVRRDRTFEPSEKNHSLYEELYGLYNRIYASLVDHCTALVQLRDTYQLS